MIKPLILSTVIATAHATTLLAADLPARSVSPVFAEPASAFDWTGSYAGVSLGVGLANSPILNRSLGLATDRASGVLNALNRERLYAKDTGVLGGGQIGYNHQINPGSGLVVGFELDANYTDLRGRRIAGSARSWGDARDSDRTYTENVGDLSQARLDFLGTARGRIGYGIDRVLVYGTAGLAYGTTGYRGTITDTYRWASTLGMGASETTVYSAQSHRPQMGYVVGGGVEYALPADSFLNFFGAAATLRAEYLHLDLGSQKIGPASEEVSALKSKPAGTSIKANTSVDMFRAGINYRFGIF